ncbi:DEAD/DEAH box helicase [Hoyosella rhizosphaerae]|uniref:Helicase n=1 Tax=Hoyosella rhizosphaerae TaxID=1755582 RepID=A0A916UHG2_9ACTN|nr:DEAD/DEAH box helicase [Hoyosella rhizosphaerae]MBN4928290.1 DEAD/DEAH box helicase [Hoyosella rhizosphaerae]GGC73854.1 helicase [Hoyosella rhizosphaerae]
MSELLPLAQAESIKHSLLEYLGTTFALADPDARRVLDDFLQHRETGMFRGPYVRLRLPFRPAEEGWRDSLEWYEGFTPYGHQAAAFSRLSTFNLSEAKSRPLPTLVTTGTGSGKTEAFLYPILDHVQRSKREGVTGTKAIILYPMNALANDQALRLARIITEHTALSGITAALYTGEAGAQRTKVTEEGLVTDRNVIRDLAPDILLTNYKMLDQLLLRAADAGIWRQSAHSLQYLVLDEFHTYDGAQGTDVSMLLRRLGLTIKSHWNADDPEVTPEDWDRPLGRITPVATSATLGDGGDPSDMLEFAHTVFGEPFTPDAVVTESRLAVSEWVGDAEIRAKSAKWREATLDSARMGRLATAVSGETDPHRITYLVLRALYDGGSGTALEESLDKTTELALDLVKSHTKFRELISLTTIAVDITDLLAVLEPEDGGLRRTLGRASSVTDHQRRTVLGAMFTALSHIRAKFGRGAVSVDVHLWIRELTRINRTASGAPEFLWGDDGIPDTEGSSAQYLPAVYCRHCNRSGWGVVLAPTGADLDGDPDTIRRRAARKDDRFRALIHAPAEADKTDELVDTKDAASGLAWLLVNEQRVEFTRPNEGVVAEGGALPVLVHKSDTAGADSKRDTCPSCRQPEGIRFLGSAIATMLSVSLSTLFGTPDLDPAEKRALVFTDSVQDAAHRAGFVQSRSHALTLRTLLRQALDEGESDLDSLAHRMIELAGDDMGARYRLLPPELAERDTFETFWTSPKLRKVPIGIRNAVRKRLLLDIALEFGLRSAVGRTLERTGTVTAYVNVPTSVLRSSAREVVEAPDVQLTTDGFDDTALLAWCRGILLHMRARGAVEHEWFDKFRKDDGNRWWITGGRHRSQGMPGFGKGQSAPTFPTLGGAARGTDLEPIASARGWYAQWTAKTLGVPPQQGAVLARLLFTTLARRDVLGDITSPAGTQTFHIPATSIVARPVTAKELTGGAVSLICSICRDTVHSSPDVIRELTGSPCLVARCDGELQHHVIDDNFYRAMYAATDVRRVVAREHTSLLPDRVRLEYETQFKQTNPPPNAPNVLVATPTLEMGIDIGDLSAVMLSSLPRTVASYLQRIGRAGRLTGNALALAYVTARGDQLPRFTHPHTTINGSVRPPATYLDAEEILTRQFTASVVDVLARRPDVPHPKNSPEALRSTGKGTFLGALIDEAEGRPEELVDAFLAGFTNLDEEVISRLRAFPQPPGGSGTSELARRCHRASATWNHRIETFMHRQQAVHKKLPELREKAHSPIAVDEDQRELRTAEATVKLIQKQLSELRSDYWISTLESFGLFPNYTLLDDIVTLAVSVNWINPASKEYEQTSFELTRASAQALRDFAPGSTFYASGFAIAIDAVDLGADGDEVRKWACCPACGYVKELPTADSVDAPTACPRCDSTGIADTSQHLPVVELTNVSAVIRREEATIDDSTDERSRERFTIITAADIDPANVTKHWFVKDLGFGAKHLRNLEVRWLNLGKTAAGGSTRTLAGEKADASLFRLCSECGKLDTATGRNKRSDHRPWCSQREAQDESVVNLALARKLTTEGLLLRLPLSVTMGDSFAVPSLAASLLLGLRERIGGDPDHLHITTVRDPSKHSTDAHEALLLHDVVPGGTGYLAELANPDIVWDVLHRAWKIVKDCPCQDEGKLSCENCLLPFAGVGGVKKTSRAAAERHLAGLLTGREFDDTIDVPDSMPWTVTQEEPIVTDTESALEKRFRVVFKERLETLGATITPKPTERGEEWEIALGSANRWTLRPQENILGSKPDFVLTSRNPGVPPTAIFTDGWAYHASPTHNRVADDAEKRRNLRDGGYQVVAVTHEDVEGTQPESPALHTEAIRKVLQLAGDRLSKSAIDLAFRNAVDLLVAWVQNPTKQSRAQLADWLPMISLVSTSKTGVRATGGNTAALALAALNNSLEPSAQGETFVWHNSGFATAIRMPSSSRMPTEVAVIFDDDDTALTLDSKLAWREWLRWANLLNFRPVPSEITTRKHLASAAGAPIFDQELIRLEPVAVGLSDEWQEAYDEVTSDAEKALIKTFADHGIPVPSIGEEINGIPVEISWPELKVLLDTDVDNTERDEFTQAGWVVCAANITALKAALQEGRA